MTELLFLNNMKVLCLFDTGSNVNLISESVIQNSEYLSSISTLDCPDYTIRNTTGEMNAIKCYLPKQLRNGDFVAKPFCQEGEKLS